MIALLLACAGPAPQPPADEAGHPRWVVTAEQREPILARLDRQPWASALQILEEDAARSLVEPDPEHWDHDTHASNGQTAMAAAMIAWLFDDAEAAAHAREAMALLTDDFETNLQWDVNIRMPGTLMGFTFAHDLLSGTALFPEAEASALQGKLTTITKKFFDAYVVQDPTRQALLGVSQNNHPIRTAAAIAAVALAFDEHPDASRWADFAISELDYLWGPGGQYVQADGGVSEGPHYHAFAFSPSVALALALRNGLDAERTFARSCLNRQDIDPWAGHGCVEGEPLSWTDPLDAGPMVDSVDWSIALRLPDGDRPPLGDAYLVPFNGAPLVAPGSAAHRLWDWQTSEAYPMEAHRGFHLSPFYVAYLPDVEASEPPWRNRFFPDGGNAVLRSGWDADARWLMLVAEPGAARKTLHDHVDGTSFSLAAYGEYLLIDPGYHKPNDLNNAVTAQSQSHNVVLVDGQGAPDKGLLTDFGDADAALHHAIDGDTLAYVEAHQAYEGVQIQRSVVFVDRRWYAVVDRISDEGRGDAEFRWRVHGWAGHSWGERFELQPDGATFARGGAGVDLFVASTAPGLTVVEPPLVSGEPPHVDLFDHDRTVGEHGVMDAIVEGTAPDFVAVLAPWRAGASPGEPDGPLAVEPLALEPGVAGWRVGDDLLLLREAGAPTLLQIDDHTIETDAAFTLVRPGATAALLVRGTRLVVDGALRLQTSEPVALQP